MVPGVRGDLIAESYLSRIVEDAGTAPPPEAWVRGLSRWWRRAEALLGPASGSRLLLDVGARPLFEHLGFAIARLEPHAWGHAGVLAGPDGPVAVFVALRWNQPVGAAWREAARLGLAAALPWAIVFNGCAVTLVDCRHPWTRRVLTFDMGPLLMDPRGSTALSLFVRADAIVPDAGATRLSRLVEASERHALSVCSALGAGVFEALGSLVAGLDAGVRPRRGRPAPGREARIFDEALTVVYRLLFLLFAEARELVPIRHDVYREAYGLDTLCSKLLSGAGVRGTWATVQALSRLAHGGCRTTDLEVTAFNGRLFSPAGAPLADRRAMPDAIAARAVLALATSSSPGGRRRIAFHDLGVEQLGSVYERVLELEPTREARALVLKPTSSERKRSGSFYTPRSMTDFIVRRTLGPLVDGRSAEAILDLRILDPAMGSGAFLVAACRYLADRAEQALVAEGHWPDHDTAEPDRAALRRTVAERCLYGVDVNPTAVQLARLSLWLTTLAARKPLTFLDHHLASGNSLVGARLGDLPRLPPGSPARPAPHDQRSLFDDRDAAGMARAVLPDRRRLAREASDTVEAVRDKERRLEQLLSPDGPLARWSRAADVWTGLQLHPPRGLSQGLYTELQHHAAGSSATTLPARHLSGLVDAARQAARAHAAFHWELAFPEVFLDETGRPALDAGFDAVIGNPPWEMVRADTGTPQVRHATKDPAQALVRFVRGSGHYPWHGGGHVNQYQLFVERALQVLRPGGRLGLILPSGIQSDVGSSALRRALLDGCRVDTWIGLDNRHAIFPIHRGIRFAVVAGTRGGTTDRIPFQGAITHAEDLARLPDDPRTGHAGLPPVDLARALLDRWDPVHLTVPALDSPLDRAVLIRALEAPALGDTAGWGVRFGRELNATEDRHWFTPRRPDPNARTARLLPIVEGKHLRPFGVTLDAAAFGIDRDAAARLIDPAASFLRPRIAYRDVASARNRVTLIAAVLPVGTLSTHTVFCARTVLAEADQWCLTGLLNSLVANYLVRLQMSTHVTTALMARLPVPRPRAGSQAHADLAALAQELAQGAIDDRPGAYARLNAVAAAAYRLSTEEYRHVVGTFPLLPQALRAACIDAHTSPTTKEPRRR